MLEILAQMGCRVERGGESVQVARFGRLYGAGRVFTGVYPALATDAAPPLAAAMLCAEGESSIEDVIFERRFACAEGFAALGGRVNTAGRVLHIRPGGALRGTRAGAGSPGGTGQEPNRRGCVSRPWICGFYRDFGLSWSTNLPRNEARVTPGEKNTPKKPNLS